MTSRQDAWTQDEDLLLAEIVLRHIREGGTQLAAFEEVGQKLSRTSAACGFRWNSYVRKKYKTGIELAKKQRKALKSTILMKEQHEQKEMVRYDKSEKDLSIAEVIRFLERIEKGQQDSVQLVQENEGLQRKLEHLQEQVMQLEKEKRMLQNNLLIVEDDYKSLIEIMERARKMVVLKEDDKSKKVKFQMDKNGNLERLEK
ncbi:RsfA family transcriptional regulator [Metabacillus iocasae]|uniref:RsfA family transcription factor n=1 Tax=Priestia iocasae TaxID=2291674 RepID=A0ABS2QQM1_9BACI|nr:RsfA family transcriptional regulator [Metabacillus iocasae]MBM7701758.1 RsfA family transcription factor [Metabacillus iocasae]